jgi:GT2 family glycosyltransferase
MTAPPSGRIDYSVAIPAYGRTDLLAACLERALAQRWPPDMNWEIVVNDDCSEPSLESRLPGFRGRVRFERNAVRAGWPENWNQTLRKARGAWVHMLHHDDLVAPAFAATMWQLIRTYPRAAYLHSAMRSGVIGQSPIGRLYCRLRARRCTTATNETARVFSAGPEAARHALRQGVRIVTIVVRRDLACSIPGMRKELLSPADEEFVVRLALRGDVVYCPEALCTYLYHAGQCSQASWLESSFVSDYLAVHEEALKTLGAGATEDDRRAMRERVAGVACGVALARALAGRPREARTALEEAASLSPDIRHTGLFRRMQLLVKSRIARFAYRCVCG